MFPANSRQNHHQQPESHARDSVLRNQVLLCSIFLAPENPVRESRQSKCEGSSEMRVFNSWCCFFCLVANSCLTLLLLHGLQPTRLLCSWDFPGKNTGVDCHFISFSRGSSRPRDWTQISCIGRRILYQWVTRGAQNCFNKHINS